MPNTNPCPTCHAQLDPGTPHTFCARTKEPKARDLATRIAAMEANFDLLHRLTVDKREKDSLASKMDNLFGGGIDLATRVEALETDTHGLNGRFVRIDTFNGWASDLFKRLEALERAKENTGAARGDGSERQPSDSHGQHGDSGRSGSTVEGQRSSVPVAVDPYKLTDEERGPLASRAQSYGTANSGSPFKRQAFEFLVSHVESLVTRAVRRERELVVERLRGMASEVQSQRYCTAERAITDAANTLAIEHGGGGHAAQSARNETTEQSVAQPPSAAASALPMPERPETLDWKIIGNVTSLELAEKFKVEREAERLYALSLESRLAEVRERADIEIACGEKLIDSLRACESDRDALKAKLAEASKSAWPVTDLNTEEECVTVLRMFGNPQASRVADVLEGITASRDALRAKLDGVREAAEKWTFSVGDQVSFWDAVDTFAKTAPMSVARCDAVVRVNRAVEETVRKLLASALAAAENTNTGTVGADCVTAQVGTQPKQPRHTTSQSSRPLTEPDAVGDSSRHGSEPAVPVPSSATAFEMTPEQRRKLLDSSLTGTDEDLMQFVRSLVRSELRKAREGWVTREVALVAMRDVRTEGDRQTITKRFVPIDYDAMLDLRVKCMPTAIRAASKEADSFRAGSSIND